MLFSVFSFYFYIMLGITSRQHISRRTCLRLFASLKLRFWLHWKLSSAFQRSMFSGISYIGEQLFLWRLGVGTRQVLLCLHLQNLFFFFEVMPTESLAKSSICCLEAWQKLNNLWQHQIDQNYSYNIVHWSSCLHSFLGSPKRPEVSLVPLIIKKTTSVFKIQFCSSHKVAAGTILCLHKCRNYFH